MANSSGVAVALVIGSKDKSVGWYDKSFPGVNPDARNLLETYAHIAPEKVDDYAVEMVRTRHSVFECSVLGFRPHGLTFRIQRDRAWDIFPYPCIGQFRFLDLALCKQPSYGTMLQRLKAGAKYVDIGCCIGQDIRKLVADGAPGENLYGAEL